MDSYVDQFQAAGGSLVMLAKGNRSKQVTDACKRHGGFYLGSIGGPAARLAQDCITKVEVLEYPELGMEAVWRIEVRDFPAFIVVDDKGNDFFADVSRPVDTGREALGQPRADLLDELAEPGELGRADVAVLLPVGGDGGQRGGRGVAVARGEEAPEEDAAQHRDEHLHQTPVVGLEDGQDDPREGEVGRGIATRRRWSSRSRRVRPG